MVIEPGRSASQASPKAAAITPMMKSRSRIMSSGLRFSRRSAHRRKHSALQSAQRRVGGDPRVCVFEPAGKGIARGSRERVDLFHGGGYIPLFEMGRGSRQHGAGGIAGFLGVDAADLDRRFCARDDAVEK